MSQGGGQFRIFENGRLFEKVGVNFSEVYGKFPKELKGQIPGTKKNLNFWASGISVVMHMKNPHIPAMHFNTRYIFTSHGWFGGGMDVTPCLKDESLKNGFTMNLKKLVTNITKISTKNIKSGVKSISIYPTGMKRGELGVFFLIIKK